MSGHQTDFVVRKSVVFVSVQSHTHPCWWLIVWHYIRGQERGGGGVMECKDMCCALAQHAANGER